jgi:hypothetical protein
MEETNFRKKFCSKDVSDITRGFLDILVALANLVEAP